MQLVYSEFVTLVEELGFNLLQMPRTRQRKTKKKKASWSKEILESAIKAVQDGKPIRSVSKSFNIPFSTLQEQISKDKTEGPKLGRSAVFTEEQEEGIANHAQLLGRLFHGLTPVQLHRIAFEFAERNGIKHNLSKYGCTAGKDRLANFLKRNRSVSIRKPEATSINRIEGFSKTEVTRFYNNLEEVMVK
jgi:transposase